MAELDALHHQIQQDIARQWPDLSEQRRSAVARVAALSDYFQDSVKRAPSIIIDLFESGDMEEAYADDAFSERVAHLSLENLDAGMREIRRREMCRIIYRDLNRIADLEETTRDLSNLADAALNKALACHYLHHCEIWGTPVGDETGEPQQMSILALGKLGAQELNLSSDIDLVFLYDEQGMVQGRREMSNQEFFIRTSRSVIASLDAVREGGFVFRVDMRLRPYGDSGALILCRAAMEKYFIEQGRDWERYAFIPSDWGSVLGAWTGFSCVAGAFCLPQTPGLWRNRIPARNEAAYQLRDRPEGTSR